MRFNRSSHVLRAPEDDGGAGAAAAAPAPAAAAPASDAGGAATTPAAAPVSALAAGASAPAPAPAAVPAAPDPVFGVIPEKFRVKNEDGTPNLDASWLKVEEHRANLERRMGAGEAPPKEATDYKVNVPEALKDAIKSDELAASDKFKDFTAEMHKAGLSQKQFDQVVGKMLDYSMALQQGMAGLNEQQAVADLKATWADDATFKTNVQAAYRAASTFGDIDKLMGKYGNDPEFIRFAAKVGAELAEDTSASGGAVGASSDAEVESLTKEPAYWNPNDPKHAEVKQKVEAFYARKFGTGAKASGSLSIGSVG